MKLPVKWVVRSLPLLLLLPFGNGCTYALWTNGNLDAFKEPAQNPDLHLYQSWQRKDILVVYNEHSERRNTVRRRAYWLNQNQCRVEKQDAPIFARKQSFRHVTCVPVFYSTPVKTDVNRGFYAMCDTNQQSFTIFSGNREIGSYDFPVYNDGWGNVEKVALTPFAVSADAAIVGVCAGIICLYASQGF
jgi:hypothetical protein